MNSDTSQPLIWQGKELRTMGDIMRAVEAIDTPETAREFMATYRAFTPHADENIGYMTGYYDVPTMRRLQELFSVAHPIFGSSVPTPEEAFAMGEQLGKEHRQ